MGLLNMPLPPCLIGVQLLQVSETWVSSVKRGVRGAGGAAGLGVGTVGDQFLHKGRREGYVSWASSFFYFKGSGEVLLWNNPNETVQFSYPPAIHVILLAQNSDEVTPLEGQFV